jgi:hypothetical protein
MESSITNYKHKNMNLTSIFRICKTNKEELLKPETSLSVRQTLGLYMSRLKSEEERRVNALMNWE